MGLASKDARPFLRAEVLQIGMQLAPGMALSNGTIKVWWSSAPMIAISTECTNGEGVAVASLPWGRSIRQLLFEGAAS
jgi:hypothetical protein